MTPQTGDSLQITPVSRPWLVRFAEQRGIYYGWFVLLASFSVSFAEMTIFNPTLSLFIVPMEREFGWNRVEFSSVVLVSTFAAAFFAPFAGGLIDRFGPRIALIIGSTVLAISLLGLSGVGSLAVFYAVYALARAAGTAVTGLANTVAVSNWFSRRRARALGIMVTAWRVGGTVLPVALAVIIGASGWRAAWFSLGIMVAVMGILPPLLLTLRRPEDFGLQIEGAVPRAEGAGALHDDSWTLSEAVRTPALWLVAFTGLCAWFPGAAYNLHLVPYLLGKGYSDEVAVGTLAGYGLVSCFSTIIVGMVADRCGIRPALIGVFLVAAIGAAQIYFLLSPMMIVGFVVCYGTAFGGFVTLQQSVWADYYGRGALGSIRGIAQPVQLMGNAFGPFLAALLYDNTGTYDLAFGSYVLVSLLGAVAMFVARRPHRRSGLIAA